MPEAELDLRLHRLLFFADGVYAIAVTLLAVELVLPEAAADLHGRELLDSLLESWPRVLAFLTSFLFIANFWVGHNVLFYQVRRFDGGLLWLALVQLLCIAFLPFPTSVVGEHVSDSVAQQFYFGSLLVTGLLMWALWWHMSSGRRLVDPDLSPRVIRRHHLISSGVPASVLLLMVLVALGVGHFINPLVLAYLFAFGYVVLGGSRNGSRCRPRWSTWEHRRPTGRGMKGGAKDRAVPADSRTSENPLTRSSENLSSTHSGE